MASPEPSVQQADHAQESSTSSAAPAAAGQEEAPPQEPVPEPSALGAEAEKEEEGECGFCIYMKAGGCHDAFTAWLDCVEASDKEGGDMVERCAQTTINLKNCMDAHADYYAPVLQAEQAVSAQAEAAAEAEKDKGGEVPSAATPSSDEVNEEGTTSSSAVAGEGKQEEANAEKILEVVLTPTG